jgi:phosphatidylinositol alpha-mannosyltransferase
LATLVALGFAKINTAQVGHALTHIRGGWVALAVVLLAGAFMARAESWFAAIRAALPDQRIGRPAVTRVLLIGMAGSTVAPGRLGEAARAWLIARRAGGGREALATVVGTLLAQTLLNILALAILAIVALAGSAIPGAHTEAIVVAAALPAGILIALIVAPKVLGADDSFRLGALARFAAWVRRQLTQVRRGLSVFRDPRTAMHSLSFQLGAWAMQWGACYAVILAFGLERRATIAAAAAVLLAVNVTAVLPVTPSNLGVFQAACRPCSRHSGSAPDPRSRTG